MMRLRATIGVGLVLLAVAACDRGDPQLMNVRATGAGPDEFAILPTQPLQMPTDLSALPTPTPGGTNLTDPDPEADAIAALGGNASRGVSGDQGFFNHVGRFGVSPEIRNTLAAEDIEFRRNNRGRLLERLLSVNVYLQVYSVMSLDRYAELERLRRAGIRTPAAPPAPAR